ncbi:class I SAM-dependent methyltransferase [Caulobacter mirabilis]|uniref:Methyltransferase type 12 n=1 Tax=Caulobacter mirabilis TaxID=69666 RepID=A0A2D2B2V0_9CAUL|nr:class I SAM-dependent methyltransferase [Caulobacter mirabilis]ATQ44580.1 methyltransferase type 12 [Caulobacter mirabilis]
MAYLRWRRFLELTSLDHPWVGEMFMRRRNENPAAPDAETWDKAYKEGVYQRLLRSEQRHHHRLLAGLVTEHCARPRILEIGCGEGAFYDAVRPFSPARYLGADFSPQSIDMANARLAGDLSPGKVDFVVGDGRAFVTDEQFDAIVFPECIEYLGDPDELFAHYARNLAPGGLFGVTQWLGLKPLRTWRAIKASTDIVDEAVVNTPWGGAWQVWTCRRRGA